MDIKLVFDPATQTIDIALAGGQLVTDDTLETAVIISWFTNRRANDDDVLPDYVSPQMPGTGDRRGWWGDHFSPAILAAIAGGIGVALPPPDRWGSRFWLLSREKELPEVLTRTQQYGDEALQWMLDAKIATSVTTTASFVDGNPGSARTLRAKCEIVKPNGSTEMYAYDFAWRAQAGAVGVPAALVPSQKLDSFILNQSALA